jgi:hypothetical protein
MTFLGALAEGDVRPLGRLQTEIHARDGRENPFAQRFSTLCSTLPCTFFVMTIRLL